MNVLWVDILYGVIVAGAGIGLGIWLRRSGASGTTKSQDEIQHAREVLKRLHELAVRVAADVGEHHSRVEEINEELTSGDVSETEAVVAVVDRIIQANNQMQEQLGDAEQKLQEQAELVQSHAAQARTDALTGLANRRELDDEMARRHAEFQRDGDPLSLVMIDVDHFKKFNDTYGHQAGDEVLRGMGSVLRESAREMDLVARYGGEEFASLLPNTELADASVVAERVRRAIDEAVFHYAGKDLRVKASLGVAEIQQAETVAELIQRADEALYTSKEAGRNCVHWHNGKKAFPVRVAEKPSDEPSSTEAIETATEQPTVETQVPEPAADQPTELPGADSQTQPEPAPAAPTATDRSRDRDAPQAVLHSRTEFSMVLGRRLAEWKRGGSSPSVLLIQVDNYPAIVFRHGQQAGNLVREATNRFLGAALRDMDVVGTHDVGTFSVLLPGAAAVDAINVAERLRKTVASFELPLGDGSLKFTVSVAGTEAIEGDGRETLLQRCQEALDAARHCGGNRTHFHDGRSAEPADTWLERLSATSGPSQ